MRRESVCGSKPSIQAHTMKSFRRLYPFNKVALGGSLPSYMWMMSFDFTDQETQPTATVSPDFQHWNLRQLLRIASVRLELALPFRCVRPPFDEHPRSPITPLQGVSSRSSNELQISQVSSRFLRISFGLTHLPHLDQCHHFYP